MTKTTYEYIKNLIGYNTDLERDRTLASVTLLVHISIIEKVIRALEYDGINVESEMWAPYTLEMNGKCFDMCVLRVAQKSRTEIESVEDFITYAKFAFPWEDSPTLFVAERHWIRLEEFIEKHNLKSYIVKIDEQLGFTADDGHQNIMVVTFNPMAYTLNIYEKYAAHIRRYINLINPTYLFVTNGFAWLQPNYLDHFKIEIDEQIYKSLVITLKHLGQLHYTNELNIFDLARIRLALCDACNPTPESDQIKQETSFMIKRELAKAVVNNQLNLDHYLMEKNLTHVQLLLDYLVYEFQNHFETIVESSLDGNPVKITEMKIRCTIKLANDALRNIKAKNNIEFTIDGKGIGGMCLSLFLNLIASSNVTEIRLDTNYPFVQDTCELTRAISNDSGVINVNLIGDNNLNFIENFLTSLKMVSITKGRINLNIYYNLADYAILEELPWEYRIQFVEIKIDKNMLESLHKCTRLELARIMLRNCKFENTRDNWELFDNLSVFSYVSLIEEEGTWQALFEFISDQLIKTNSKSFRFKNNFYFEFGDHRSLDLEGITFAFDELSSKIELRYNNRMVDLYDIKNERKDVDMADYDFYQ